MEVLGFKFFLTYGAWHASSGCGVMAWVQVDEGGQEVAHHVAKCNSSSVVLVEIGPTYLACRPVSLDELSAQAGLLVLEWALQSGFLEVCIRADCAAFVQGFFGPEEADCSLQSALMDFCSLFTCFNVVKVVKVDRNVVKPAHVKS